ncbi:MAG: hypothetical protein IJF23_04105 [Clostridia bacterium]|nr:hypothetical protein [Clostridia bacterium]
MGKLSFTAFLVRAAKISLGYFIIIPIFFGLLCEGFFSLLEIFDLKETTKNSITVIVQIVLTFLPAITQSMRDGYRDSFYGRYSLLSYLLIPLTAAVVFISVDQLPNVNICPIINVLIYFRLDPENFSILYFLFMFALTVLFYFLGRRYALYENAEAVYKTEKSVDEEEKRKKEQKTSEKNTSLPEPRKTGTWRDSINRDE